jgi:hypothetical protein
MTVTSKILTASITSKTKSPVTIVKRENSLGETYLLKSKGRYEVYGETLQDQIDVFMDRLRKVFAMVSDEEWAGIGFVAEGLMKDATGKFGEAFELIDQTVGRIEILRETGARVGEGDGSLVGLVVCRDPKRS